MDINKNFVFLPSDSNLDIFPDNSPSKFTVEFESPLQFERIQQCALFDISLPALKPKSKSSIIKIAFCPRGYSSASSKSVWNFSENIIHDYLIETESMSDIDLYYRNFIEKVNDHGLTKDFMMKFFIDKNLLPSNIKPNECLYTEPHISYTNRYDREKGKLIFGIKIFKGTLSINLSYHHPRYFTNNDIFFIFDDYVNKMLWIRDDIRIGGKIHGSDKNYLYKDHLKKSKINVGDYFVDFSRHEEIFAQVHQTFHKSIYEIYVLCNIVIDSYINNLKFQFLRQLNVNIDGEPVSRLDKLMFFPVIIKTIKSITIEIVDLNFSPTKFQTGSAIIVICFQENNGSRYI